MMSIGTGGTRTAPTPRLSTHYSIPEWIIVVQCQPNGVTLSPSHLTIPRADLSTGKGGDMLLIRTVRGLIEQRRSAQRPEDPPVKIVVRFQVDRNSLRTFHLAYPLLDGIDVEKRAVLASE
jgi:hypothetical protein